jgi:hypothetical protein
MTDIPALCLAIILFALALTYVRGCDRLKGSRS